MTASEKTDILEELQYYKNEVKRIWSSYYSFDQIMGNSLLILEAKTKAWNMAPTHTPILLAGEQGTGKRLFAHAIHQDSPQKDGPFITINCMTDPELARDKLLGSTETASGLFNPANKDKPSYYAGATVFVHEVLHLPVETQNQLVEILVNSSFANKTRPAFPRLIATSSQSLKDTEQNLSVSKDFMNFINDSIIILPPLRSRLEDIPAVCHRFIHEINTIAGTTVTGISDRAMDFMIQYDWPGNISELKAVIERACLDAQTGLIEVDNLYLLQTRMQGSDYPPKLKEAVMRAEKEAILKALAFSKGNKKQAAELLGITRTSLYNKIKDLNLDV
ncbi:MAG TPA: sigma 54-interacting transcriptional regulator [Syntrophomonadaceae bacterium]|nr:sigma 54-interacting transcriptional regulator [Syntrophomonadaceae bacterium]